MYIPGKLILKNFLSHQDSTYEFRCGRPTLLVGENLDNNSQKGNGSGKSALIESIPFALMGEFSRKVNLSELIGRGSKTCSVEFHLRNSLTGLTLKIKRSLQPSQVLEVYKGEEKIVQPSTNEYNKWIINEIGISKEDLLTFFIITKEKYTPFLLSPDSKKKEVITRFTKSDKVDDLIDKFPTFKSQHSKKIDENKILINTHQNTIISYQELLSKSSKEEWEKAKTLELESLNKKLVNLQGEFDFYDRQNKQLEGDLKTLNSTPLVEPDYTEINKNIINLEKGIESNKTLVLSNREKSNELDIKLNSETRETNESLSRVRTVTIGKKSKLSDLQSQKQEFELFLGGKVSCPSCLHEFFPSNLDVSIEDIQSLLVEVMLDMEDLEVEIKDLVLRDDTLSLQLKDLREKHQILQSEITKENILLNSSIRDSEFSLDNFKRELSKMKRNYEDEVEKRTIESSRVKKKIQELINELNHIQEQYASTNTLIKQWEDKEYESDSTGLSIEKNIQELNTQISTLLFENTELVENFDDVSIWEIRFKSFRNYLTNKTISHISEYSNSFLTKMGSDLSIELGGYKERADKSLKEEISVTVLRNGFKVGSYGSFSSGERGRIDIACIITLQELINLTSPSGGLDLLICDEVLDSMDTLGLENIFRSIGELGKTILLVSQNEVNSLKENTLVIQKKDGNSKLIFKA